jgi:hypothetical protein
MINANPTMSSLGFLDPLSAKSRRPLTRCTGPPADAPGSCYDHDDLVTVTVQGQDFKFFRRLLIYHSGYFSNILSPNKPEGEYALIVKIDNVAPYLFKAFRLWIYTGRFRDRVESPNNTEPYAQIHVYLKLWLLADFLRVQAMKNTAIDKLHELTVLSPKDSKPKIKACLKAVYEQTVEGAPLRQFAVDWATSMYKYEEFMAIGKEYLHADLLLDVLKFAKAHGGNWPVRTEEQWRRMNRCRCWHDHSEQDRKHTVA